jgi:hypothetical protein
MKNQPAKRVNIVSVKLVKESSLLYKERSIKSPEDVYNLMNHFLHDLDKCRLNHRRGWRVCVSQRKGIHLKGAGCVKELDWFVKTLEYEFQVEAERGQIGYEGNELYLDEIDESLIPPNMLDNLPKSLLFETMVFDSEEGTEWIGVIALHPETREWCLQVILKNGEPVLRRKVGKEDH